MSYEKAKHAVRISHCPVAVEAVVRVKSHYLVSQLYRFCGKKFRFSNEEIVVCAGFSGIGDLTLHHFVVRSISIVNAGIFL